MKNDSSLANNAQLRKLSVLMAIAAILVVVAPSTAHSSCTTNISTRWCDLQDPTSCEDTASNGAISWDCPDSTNYVSVKMSTGTSAYPIDVPMDATNSMACRYIKNTSGNAVFVPFRTWQEWRAFIGNHPDTIELPFCGRPTQFIISPDVTKCLSPNPSYVIAYVPTGNLNTLQVKTEGYNIDYVVAFSCGGNTPNKGLEIISMNYKVAPTAIGGNLASNDVPYTPNTWVTSTNAAASGWTQTGSSEIILGGCGTALGTPVPGNATAPNGTLCATEGSAPGVNVTTSVSAYIDGTPQWSWACSQTGSTQTPANVASVTCTAPITAACGTANGTLTAVQPSGATALCAYGSAVNMTSAISGGQHIWTWQCDCTGSCTPGYTSSTCSATDSATAQCGTADGKSLATAPTASPSTNLCAGGTASTVTALGPGGTGPWTWTCTGSTQVTCNANLSAGCGTANGTAFTTDDPPVATTPDLCVDGNTASSPTGSGPWSWTCIGSSGETATCSALLNADGVCGADNGQVLPTAPTKLCVPSAAVAVKTVSGGWTWQCPGTNGGATANCSASEAPSGPACGPGAFIQITCPDDTIDVPPPSTNEGKCSYGTPSSVVRKSSSAETSTDRYYYSGHLYWEWTCTAGGTSIYCQVPICSCAMCGFSFNNTSVGASSSAPSGLTNWELCMNGTFDSTFGFKQNTTNSSTPYYNPTWSKWWVWKCTLVRDDGTTNTHSCHSPRL